MLYLLLLLGSLFCTLGYLSLGADRWLVSLAGCFLEELVLLPFIWALLQVLRAGLALKNPEVLMVVVRKWVEEDGATGGALEAFSSLGSGEQMGKRMEKRMKSDEKGV